LHQSTKIKSDSIISSFVIANEYSDNTGVVLEVRIKYKPYQLKNNYSPTNKNHKSKIRKIRKDAFDKGFTCLVNNSGDEIIVFDISSIFSVILITI